MREWEGGDRGCGRHRGAAEPAPDSPGAVDLWREAEAAWNDGRFADALWAYRKLRADFGGSYPYTKNREDVDGRIREVETRLK